MQCVTYHIPTGANGTFAIVAAHDELYEIAERFWAEGTLIVVPFNEHRLSYPSSYHLKNEVINVKVDVKVFGLDDAFPRVEIKQEAGFRPPPIIDRLVVFCPDTHLNVQAHFNTFKNHRFYNVIIHAETLTGQFKDGIFTRVNDVIIYLNGKETERTAEGERGKTVVLGKTAVLDSGLVSILPFIFSLEVHLVHPCSTKLSLPFYVQEVKLHNVCHLVDEMDRKVLTVLDLTFFGVTERKLDLNVISRLYHSLEVLEVHGYRLSFEINKKGVDEGMPKTGRWQPKDDVFFRKLETLVVDDRAFNERSFVYYIAMFRNVCPALQELIAGNMPRPQPYAWGIRPSIRDRAKHGFTASFMGEP